MFGASGFLLLVLASAGVAQAPRLLVAGAPQLGRTVHFEMSAPAGDTLYLGVDLVPGPLQLGALTVELGLSPAFQLIPLGISTGAATRWSVPIPAAPSLTQLHFYLQGVAISPGASLSLSQGIDLQIAAAQPIDQVDDWCYQLQGAGGNNLSLGPIANTAFDLCVTDNTRDGSSEFSAAEVASLRSPAEPNRIRLAYLSIGEAEDYRWYWPLISPSLVASANPNWPGNSKVFYWMPEWKEVIIHGNAAVGASYLDRIIDQGFDGVYLDIIDAFEFFGPSENGGADLRRDAALEMVNFVLEIAHHARVVRGRPDFLIVPQNGATIITSDFYPSDTLLPTDPATPQLMAQLQKMRFLDTVDAIGAEDSFYIGGAPQNNPFNPDNYRLGVLDDWVAYGRPVLSVEYITNPSKVSAFYGTHAPAHSFVPYATVRDLDQLIINPAFPPN